MTRLSTRLGGIWALLLCLACASAPQTQPDRTTHQPAAQAPSASQTQSGDESPSEKKITPEEAKELFRSVDEILQFVSKDTGLPIKHKVKRRLTSRDELVAYMTKHMAEDKDAKRLERSQIVLKKFGLVPRDFDLKSFLVALLKEQVAGYYDPKTKTVNLLDWVDPEQQKPVLAHELTHALQDQSFGLEKWLTAGESDLDDKDEITPQALDTDEVSSARQAVVEGQAMVSLIDYILAPSGQSLQTSPQIAQALKEGMLVGTPDSVQFQNAPMFLKQAITFPYRYGIDFEAALLNKKGKDAAFTGAFRDPPQDTRQIMEPDTYLSGQRIALPPLPDFKALFRNYDRFDVSAMGEFDVALLVDQYAGVETARDLYPAWRGGYYYAAIPKADPNAPLALLYVSRWSNPERAAQFAAIYAQYLPKRYRHIHDDDPGSGQQPTGLETLKSLTGKRTWLTEEGPVVIESVGDTVLVAESLDEKTVEGIRDAIFPAGISK